MEGICDNCPSKGSDNATAEWNLVPLESKFMMLLLQHAPDCCAIEKLSDETDQIIFFYYRSKFREQYRKFP
jgi:hypothetical protein